MNREIHELVQGSPEWHAFRLNHDGASEAAAMLGLSKYVTRSELLRQKASGIPEDVDAGKQYLFDRGHAAEAGARPLAEAILADDLYPATYSYGRLSASCDGLTMDGTTAWEHKLHRADLAESIARGELPDEYQPQCQQVMMVTGAEQVLFMVSDGTANNCEHMFVRPHGKWMERVKAGWAMFHQDLDNYKPIEVLPPAVATPTMQLPALSIQVTGSIALVDNLKVFGERLESFIAGLDLKPTDDQSFADAEAAIKTLGTAETALEAAKASALAQTASIDEMTRTVALYAGQARSTRLMLEKLVKARKESIRVEIVQGGKDALAAHVAGLNKRIGRAYMPPVVADFAGAAKGKRTIASLRDAVDTALAQAKIAANETADKIAINLNTLSEHGKEYGFLFADLATVALKDCDDFAALVKLRIAEHKAAEEKRIEAEREKIRAEEAAKLKAEQERQARAEAERVAREQAENTRRLAEEARAKEQAAAKGSGEAAQNGNCTIEGAKAVQSTAIQHPSSAAAPKPQGDLPAMRPELAAETGGSGSPGTFLLIEHLRRQREFSERVFGPGARTEGVVDHIRKELDEILETPLDISEWIDVVILALDGAWRAGASPEQIISTLVTKQEKNERRAWPDWRTAAPGKAIEHIKEAA